MTRSVRAVVWNHWARWGGLVALSLVRLWGGRAQRPPIREARAVEVVRLPLCRSRRAFYQEVPPRRRKQRGAPMHRDSEAQLARDVVPRLFRCQKLRASAHGGAQRRCLFGPACRAKFCASFGLWLCCIAQSSQPTCLPMPSDGRGPAALDVWRAHRTQGAAQQRPAVRVRRSPPPAQPRAVRPAARSPGFVFDSHELRWPDAGPNGSESESLVRDCPRFPTFSVLCMIAPHACVGL